jgi:translation initiation factor IF-2
VSSGSNHSGPKGSPPASHERKRRILDEDFAGRNTMTRKKASQQPSSGETEIIKLEIVLKCDVAGTVEAVGSSLSSIHVPGVEIDIIQSGVGNITKSDVLMAQTASRLVIGFNVGTMPKLEQHIKEHGVEVRLYETIYSITEDIKKIANNLKAKEPEEIITGKAKIIATFSKGAIIGCEVTEGNLELGKNFRVITAMGPAYIAKITSLQIERKNVKLAKSGQQVGIKISDWKKAKVGDLIECFETVNPSGGGSWRPRSGVFRSKG